MQILKVYIIGEQDWYSKWIPNHILVDDILEADLVMLTGGEDLHPSWYNSQMIHPKTSFNYYRDCDERDYLDIALKCNKKLIGCCRGGQSLCVLAGGRLIQDQPNPSYLHKMYTSDSGIIEVNSTHHQAQYPFNLPKEDYKILGWTENYLQWHEDGAMEEMNPIVECEVVYYKKINALAIQPHPEMLEESHESVKYFRELLNKFLNEEL